ncbi:AMP-dependent synthetase/ligase, AMP-binding enzyme C-terminal domain protein [Artemisia annua]|uniref:AMP-dependent synthetase/ligase, AMP-binding enzyme C-terminal domain protein n=1 Tax=Artemisia annua TaxID=35608 RepID=A0A2U1KH12_ARTAN|nr:AMP-dependent synthetase/ligase, AMP-binding enzyme C-terminal domain protein [Artemisia annua]
MAKSSKVVNEETEAQGFGKIVTSVRKKSANKTKTYHSLRPPSPLPPLSTKTSITDYILSLSTSTSSATSSLIDSTTRHVIPHSTIPRLIHNLTNSLRHPPLCLRQHSVAYVISPNSSYLPILYLSLFAAGVTVSPANPVSSVKEVERMVKLCKACVVFATSDCVEKVVGAGFKGKLMEFEVWQDDIAAILYSSGYVDDKEVIDTMVDSDGWFRTGDLCYFDNEGFLFVVDRLKELIKYKGYQVPPAELEHILNSHPDITEAAVIPYPDELAGQVPMGFVVRRKGSTIDEAQVKEFVAKQVAPYKKLRRVRFTDSIPKNAPGKVLRKELIKLALSGVNSKL